MVTPRHLQIDFAGIQPGWSRNQEFAAILNSGSPLTSETEPFLNTVMARVRDQLGTDHRHLKDDIDAFIRQEAYHYRLHDSFNRQLYDAGYGELRTVALRLRASLKTRLSERSLVDNLAYCTGFENLATYMAKFIFGQADDLLEKADVRAVAMWKWHMAEEFEHRTVCHRALAALSGKYLVRVRGMISMLRHLAPYQREAAQAVLQVHRAGMTAAELADSIRRERQYRSRFNRNVTVRLAAILRPGYDPERHAVPTGLMSELDRYQKIAETGIPADARSLAPVIEREAA